MTSSEDTDSSSDFEDLASSAEDEDFVAGDVLEEQWVQLIEFCSLNSKSNESVSKNIGVEKLCQATDVDFGNEDKRKNGWILQNNNREETLVVSFQVPIFINEIHIYESLNPGSIAKLELFESNRNKWWLMWQRKSSPKKQSESHNIFKPLLRRYRILSNTIRLTIDPQYTDQIGIQAIKFLGTDVFDVSFNHKPLVQSMTELYERALNNINSDVQFIFDDKIINAHRNILCCRSTYFRSLLSTNFIEKSQTKSIVLTDVDRETFLEILYYIYTGAYHPTISYDMAMKVMVYSNKINLISATSVAIEHICRYIRLDHGLILSVYCYAKKMSPAFDLLLDCIYDLCSEHLNDICKRKDFVELDKELMIDLICQSAERRDLREEEKLKQLTLQHQNHDDSSSSDDD